MPIGVGVRLTEIIRGCERGHMNSSITFEQAYQHVSRLGSSEALEKDEAALLWEAVQHVGVDATIVEIGCEFGRSSVLFAYMVRQEVMRRLICIDPWIGANGDETEEMNVRVASNWMREMRATRAPFALYCMKSEFVPLRGSIDLLYIDGGHTAMDIATDCRFIKYVSPGGLVAFHDYGRLHYPEVKPAVDAIMRRYNYELLMSARTLRIYQIIG